MYEQTEQFGAEHVRDTITNAELSGDIKVLTGEKDTYQAKNIIIATGAKPIMPNIPGINLPGVINSDRLLAVPTWNYDRIVIMGGGVIGVEFATIFQALCSKVTIVEKGPHLLGPMDEEVSEALKEQLVKKGITVYCNAM